MIVVANKIDMEYERQVGAHEGREWAAHTGCQYIETSAKNRINVDEAFTSLVREIRKFNQVSISSRCDSASFRLRLTCEWFGFAEGRR